MTCIRKRASTGSSRTIPALGVAVISFFAGLAGFVGLDVAKAHEVNGWVWVGQDRIYNYDFKVQNQAAGNRDWPIHVMFWNNGVPSYIKQQRPDHFPYNCNDFGLCNMNFRYDTTAPGDSFVWDTDGGMKEFRCGPFGGQANAWSLHYRIYDEQGSPMWEPGWGYYAPVTTHYDYDDPNLPWPSDCDNKQHGYDEYAEYNLVSWVAAEQYWPYWRDAYHWHNPSGYRLIGGVPHYGNGNGAPSEVQALL